MATQVAFPGTVTTETGPSGDNDWTNAANISANDGSEAQITAATYDSGDHSFRLRASNFGFTIPAGATIDGITVEIEQRCFAGAARDQEVRLFDETGTLVGDDKATATAWPGTATIATYGGATDDWLPAGSWTPAQVNDVDFGAAHIVAATAANTDIGVDFIRVTIHYTPAPESIDAQPGSFTLAGTDATLQRGFNFDAQPGSFALAGTDASLLPGYVLAAMGPTPNPALRDTFTGADQLFSAYSTDWTEMENPDRLVIGSNAVALDTGSVRSSAYWNVESFGPDCDVSAAITFPTSVSSIEVSVECRIDTPGTSRNGYRAHVAQGVGSLRIVRFFRVTAGVPTQLGENFALAFGDAGWASGDVLTLRAIGDTFHVYRNGVLLGTRVDSTYTAAGLVGFEMVRTSSGTPSMDDFRADDFSYFGVTGADAGLLADRVIDAQPGVFTLTGIDAALVKEFVLSADPGTFTVTGVDATLLLSAMMSADPGSFALSGIEAGLQVGHVLSADAGTFTVSGAVASLIAGYVLDAAPGAYVVSGADAGTVVGFLLSADPGVYVVTGADAGLVADRVLAADPGSFVVTGFDAGLVDSASGPADLTDTNYVIVWRRHRRGRR